MKVREEQNPNTENIQKILPKVDFSDTFAITNHQNTLPEITNKIFGKEPKWVTTLFKIRNFIVQFMGLKTEIPENINPDFEIGGYIGFFQIYGIEKNEVILGADDTHLNFRVSIYNSQETIFNIKVTTLVEYNNKMGKIYMFLINPFHRIVVKKMISQASDK